MAARLLAASAQPAERVGSIQPSCYAGNSPSARGVETRWAKESHERRRRGRVNARLSTTMLSSRRWQEEFLLR